ncbi:MAG: helix-turn-helix domain-containing protein [Oscillospiraceae bacterium]|nr:helix-turn-helix domain-containing protein [Oscillospiraceae bacterium]
MQGQLKIGENLRTHRIGCRLTQQQVADALGIDRTTYTCYECNRTEPNIEMLKRLTDIFNISYDQLLPAATMKSAVADPNAVKKDKMYELSKFEQSLLVKMRTLTADERLDIVDRINAYIKK